MRVCIWTNEPSEYRMPPLSSRSKTSEGSTGQQSRENTRAQPAQAQIQGQGKHLIAVWAAELQGDPECRECPDHSAERSAHVWIERAQREGGIAAGDHHEDHRVIQ